MTGDAPGPDAPVEEEVVLRPDRLRAGGWSLVGVASLWLLAWSTVAGDLPRALGLGLLVAGALLTLVVAVQVVAPRAWTLRVSRDGVTGYVAGRPVQEVWEDHRRVEVARRLGEPQLVLGGSNGTGRTRRLLLPIGADVDRLRALVARIDLSGPTS